VIVYKGRNYQIAHIERFKTVYINLYERFCITCVSVSFGISTLSSILSRATVRILNFLIRDSESDHINLLIKNGNFIISSYNIIQNVF